MNLRDFKINIPDDQIEDLQRRLRATRLSSSLGTDQWDDGASLAFMQRLTEYWLNRFDWRAQEARLNRLPQYMVAVDGFDLHFVHQPDKGPAPMPLVLTHGWPGSFIEMECIIPLLADPAAHGGDPADAFHVVVPSLPGFGFSAPPTAPGVDSYRVAELWFELMHGLGYERFLHRVATSAQAFPRGCCDGFPHTSSARMSTTFRAATGRRSAMACRRSRPLSRRFWIQQRFGPAPKAPTQPSRARNRKP